MKKISYYILAILCFISFTVPVYADSIVVITGVGVRFRTSTDTSSSSNIITSFNPGAELTLIDQNVGSTSACTKWYKAKYNGTVGYVCGDYAYIKEDTTTITNPNDYEEYSEYLTELGFPSTYIPYLVNLHQMHPNWQFRIDNVDIDFNRMVKLEHDGYDQGWSLLEDYNHYYDGYKATDSWAYNYQTDVFRSNYEGGQVNRWYAPSTVTISYYLDPRNFLNERQVFMFETLSYNSSYHTDAGMEAMLRNTFMTGMADDEHTYIDAFRTAAETYNVSPYVLISRVIQEVGAWGSRITSGTVSGYEGYYNFYNIKAYGNTIDETINRGLAYAKENGWNTHYKAIVGGAAFLANNYINAGQDTLYSQKWDIVKPYVTHQYMQNIQAPANECIRTYNSYKNNDLLDSSFMFSIPVYRDMPNNTSLPDSGNPNNYLKNLTINNNTLFSEASTTTNYNLTLPYGTNSLNINYQTVNNKASVNIIGGTSITPSGRILTIEVTAQNGDKRTYSIDITVEKSTEKVTPEISFENSSYNLTYGAESFKNNITISEEALTVTYTSSNNEIATVNNEGYVTINKVGLVTITASHEEDDTYNYTEASYIINILPKEITITISNYENNYDYTGSSIKPNITVKTTDNLELVKDIDYILLYDENTNPGIGKIYINPKENSNYTFYSKTIEFYITSEESLASGDINNDGVVELHEVLYAVKLYLGVSSDSTLSVGLSDIVNILKKYFGLT